MQAVLSTARQPHAAVLHAALPHCNGSNTMCCTVTVCGAVTASLAVDRGC